MVILAACCHLYMYCTSTAACCLLYMYCISSESGSPACFIADKDSDLLTLHFAVDVGPEFCWGDLPTAAKSQGFEQTKKQKLDLVHR